MPNKAFKPMKAPSHDLLRLAEENQIDLATFPFNEYLTSVKLDGIRFICNNGIVKSARGKELGNKHFNEVFTRLIEWSVANPHYYLEGELYHPDLTFQEITSIVRSHDGELDKLQLHLFDMFNVTNPHLVFEGRYNIMHSHVMEGEWDDNVVAVEQLILPDQDSFLETFKKITEEDGGEGLMLKHLASLYKFGRATVKQGTFFKVKKFNTADVKIVGFIEGEQLKDDAEVRSGYWDAKTERSHKKADYKKSGTLGAVIVQMGGMEFKVGSGFTHDQRDNIWRNQPEYLNRVIEIRYMDCGRKNLPRIPTFVRFRSDKDN